MSNPPLPESAVAMLRRPNPAVITTIRSDGQPVSTATWYRWGDDGRVLLNMDSGRIRLRHVHNNPHVSLTVLQDDDWYTHVSLIGQITEIRDDDNLKDIDRLAHHYLGHPYPQRERPRVSAWMTVNQWHGWGNHKDSNQVG